MILTITLDDRTATTLCELAAVDGVDVSVMAARLLARAIQTARPRHVYNIEELKRANAEFVDEELALADSDWQHRLELLEAEDRA